MIQNLLIVCVGNICRSPMCQSLFIDKLSQVIPNVAVDSAGLSALVGASASELAQELMLERGMSIAQHRAQMFTTDLAYKADLILTMSTEQQQYVESKFTSMKGRVHRLGKMGGFDVPDPFQRPKIIYEQSLAMIEQGVNEWYKILWT